MLQGIGVAGWVGGRSKNGWMDIAGEGSHVITTWDGLVHSGLGGISSKGDGDGGFNGSGCFPMSSGGMALGNIGDSLVAGFRSKDTTSGVPKDR